MRAIGYTRVSTSGQALSGLGLTAQTDRIEGHAHTSGWELVDVITDAGVSARDTHRPGLVRALEAIATGDADALVVAKLDRLARSALDLAELVAWFDAADASLVVLDPGIDTSTAAGRLVVSVLGSVAEWEREIISTRTREAAGVRREQGKQMGRPGVRDTMPEVRERIRAERAAGATLQAIADGLNADQIPTVRGAALWRVSSVQVALGYTRPRATRRAASLPPIPRRRPQRRTDRTGARAAVAA